MIKNTHSSLKNIFSLIRPLVLLGFVLIIALAFIISVVLASRTPQTDDPSQQVTPFSQVGWQTYTDDSLGFSIQFPETWHKLDISKSPSFVGQCFGDVWEGLPHERQYTEVHFCVDLKPYVRLSPGGFASNDSASQQQFFESLSNNTNVEQPVLVGKYKYTLLEREPINGSPALERIEADAPGVEGTEPTYTISVYINEPQIGLVRLSMHGRTSINFEKHEDILRQMLASFSFLK